VTLDGVNPQTATLTINTSSTTPTGTANITVKGTIGPLVHQTSVSLSVQ
jgi:hypothetical protein